MISRRDSVRWLSCIWLMFGVFIGATSIGSRIQAVGSVDERYWIKGLSSRNPDKRMIACKVLASEQPKSTAVVNALLGVAQSGKDNHLRQTALIGLRHEVTAYPAIREIANQDADPEVRELACLILSGCLLDARESKRDAPMRSEKSGRP